MTTKNAKDDSGRIDQCGELVLCHGIVDKVAGIAATIILISMIPIFESAVGRVIVALAVGLAVFGTLDAFGRRIDLLADRFTVRSAFWRTSSHSYEDVEAVSFDPTSILAIVMKSGKVVSFHAKAKGMDQARKVLVARVRSAQSEV